MAVELFTGAAGAVSGWTNHQNTLNRDGSGNGWPASSANQLLTTMDAATASGQAQRVRFILTSAVPGGGSHYTGGFLRGSNGGSGLSGYSCEANSDATGRLSLNTWTNNGYTGTPHNWSKGSAWAADDEVIVTVDSSGATPTFEAFVNGVSLGTYQVPSGGMSGLLVGISIFAGSTPINAALKEWEGGDLVSATIEQEGFRWRNDDGDEDGATWAAAQDTDISAPVSENRRLRVLLNATDDPGSTQFQLEYRLAGGTYAKVLTAQPTEQIPTHVGKGTFTSGTGALSVPPPGSLAADDLLLLVVESANEAIATPTGYTQVANSPQSTGTGAAAGGVRLAVFYKVTTGSESNVTVADTGNHTTAQIHAFRGVDPTTPIHQTAGAVDAAATTALSAPAVTTTLTNCLIVNAIGLDKDAADSDTLSSVANAALSDVTEQHDQTVASGVGGGIAVITGGKATAGSTGNTTATGDSSTTHAYITIALAPVAPIVHPILLSPSAFVSAAAADTTTPQLTPPSGKTTANHQAARVSDDTNPLPAIDPATGVYLEAEYSLAAQSGVATGAQEYEFRVTKAGTALDSYTVTPSWTIASGSGGVVESEPFDGTEDEIAAVVASVRVSSAIAAIEEESGNEPDVTIYVDAAADAIEEEIAVATAETGAIVVESEPFVGIEDEVAAAAASVRVAGIAGPIEEEIATVTAFVRVSSSVAAVEDEEVDGAAWARIFAALTAVEDEIGDVDALSIPPIGPVYSEPVFAVENESGAAAASVRAYGVLTAVENESGDIDVAEDETALIEITRLLYFTRELRRPIRFGRSITRTLRF